MTPNGWLQIGVFFVLVLLLAKPMGLYMARVYERKKTWLDPVLVPVERLLYRLTAVNPDEEMRWTQYGIAMLIFSLATMLLTYAVERLQHAIPLWNPQHLAAVEPYLAWSTAGSFTTNTNWQAYVPETTMSYLSQAVGLATHNFWSAAVGMALAIAFIRGVSRHESKTLGNFWVDLTRGTLWVLLPICVVYALALVSQGAIQNFKPYDTAALLEPQSVTTTGTDGKPVTTTVTTQTIAQGPLASQEAIKMLGTNGGGFMNANSSHPFENPTPLSNLLEMVSIFTIGGGLCLTLGKMTGSEKHGWAVFAAMSILWFAGVATCYWAESQPNPLLHGVDQSTVQMGAAQSSGGNMEGKEVRFGIANSALFATVTTDACCGAVNSMHDSFMPLGGMVPLANIMAGEIVFGGVGAGMYGMLVFVVLAVFIAGLMVGRTPEYLGKKIEAYDVQMSMLYLLIFPADHPGIRSGVGAGAGRLSSISNNRGRTGSHKFSMRIRRRWGITASAFAGLNAHTHWYFVTHGICHAGRALPDDRPDAGGGRQPGDEEDRAAVAGHLPRGRHAVYGAAGRRDPDRRGADLLSGAGLGPILEHLLLRAGISFC